MLKKAGKDDEIFLNPNQAFNVTITFLDIYTLAIYPIIRTRQGVRALGLGTGWAFCALYFYASFTRSHAMFLYWYVWMAFVVLRKLTPDRGQKTTFRGTPWLANWLTLRLFPHDWVMFLEPLAVFVIAWLLKDWSLAVYKFLLGGSFCIGFHSLIGVEFRRREREAIRDAQLDAMRLRDYR